jgi:hypothetical protein
VFLDDKFDVASAEVRSTPVEARTVVAAPWQLGRVYTRTIYSRPALSCSKQRGLELGTKPGPRGVSWRRDQPDGTVRSQRRKVTRVAQGIRSLVAAREQGNSTDCLADACNAQCSLQVPEPRSDLSNARSSSLRSRVRERLVSGWWTDAAVRGRSFSDGALFPKSEQASRSMVVYRGRVSSVSWELGGYGNFLVLTDREYALVGGCDFSHRYGRLPVDMISITAIFVLGKLRPITSRDALGPTCGVP